MLKVYRLDLHVHSCLSPCAELDMHPRRLVQAAVEAGLDAVAVCEHHSTENLAACVAVGRRAGLQVIPGIEITSEEEVHINLGLREGRSRFVGLPILCSSDAHRPEDTGRVIAYMLLEHPTFLEIRRALAGKGGRAVLGGGKPMEELALHVLDIAQNALEAGATSIQIEIAEYPAENRLTIQVLDNGKGMDQAALEAALDPFFTTRTTRKVGLGLPLLAQAARIADGDLTVSSQPGAGTTVTAHFRLDHIDRTPLGDLQSTLLVLFAGSPQTEIIFRHVCGGGEFVLSSTDLAAVLDSRDLSSPEGLALLREVLERGESVLKKTKPDGSDGEFL